MMTTFYRMLGMGLYCDAVCPTPYPVLVARLGL